MPYTLERVENLLKVIDEYESVFKTVKHHIREARRQNAIHRKALNIIGIMEDACLTPEAIEALATERALFKLNAPKAKYRQKIRNQKRQTLDSKVLDSYDEFNKTATQDLNDYNAADDF